MTLAGAATVPTGGDANLWRRMADLLAVGELASDGDLARLVEDRLPVDSVAALTRHGVSDAEIYRLVLPRRTLAHRRARAERLSLEESDRLVRLARITALAAEVFGEEDRAGRWLREPKRRFDGHAPLELLATEPGARMVEEWLYQIDDGIAA